MKKYFISIILLITVIASCKKDEASSVNGNNNSTGIAGSMARFINYQNYLYIVDKTSLNIYDVSNPQNTYLIKKVGLSMSNTIETIFINNGYLYIGANDGMRIFSLSDPTNPSQLSIYSHIVSCDPVVANDTIAYVTLRTNTSCRMNTIAINSLDIVDIKNKYSPKKLKSMPMQNPHGMGLDSCFLFLCDAEAGLKVYNIKNPLNLQLVNTIKDVTPIDAIAMGSTKTLLVVTSQGFKIYNYSDINNIKFLSSM